VLRGEVATRTRDLLASDLPGRDVVITQGAISPDHIHMLVSVPPQLALAKLVQYLKGRSSRMLQDEFPQLKKRYWGQHLLAFRRLQPQTGDFQSQPNLPAFSR